MLRLGQLYIWTTYDDTREYVFMVNGVKPAITDAQDLAYGALKKAAHELARSTGKGVRLYKTSLTAPMTVVEEYQP